MINNKDIKKVGLITTLIYTMTLITSIILNQESDLKHLKNGIWLIILFYGQLIFIVINCILNSKNEKIKKILDIEIVFKVIIFVIYNLVLSNIKIEFNKIITYGLLTVSFLISNSILIYASKIKDKLYNKDEISEKIEVNTNYSLMGIILYFVAIGIYKVNIDKLTIKVVIFIISIEILNKNLIKHYNIENFKNKINIFLILGAIINTSIFIYIFLNNNKIDYITLNNIRDITVIISALFIIPYMKKTQKRN